ncbi:hypothetical protein PgNI_11473 [Pyricularia grisea]|uniref:Uncharacterized protein n=1 Tax=Pyricularia grisea TaxID=148305 RepID=A0A6P8AP64_PYRGI|nr:hypothetical protein PgNI_11473 [Pyricularia grisea]TLD03825.1 hypothetical protein PgNI_11473 [Pyricularia grisea]
MEGEMIGYKNKAYNSCICQDSRLFRSYLTHLIGDTWLTSAYYSRKYTNPKGCAVTPLKSLDTQSQG